MGAGVRCRGGIRMMENTPPRHLPVRLLPVADELLSSWIGRHAAVYAVPPLVMLRHCLPEASSLRAADLHLSSDQEIRLASIPGRRAPNDLRHCRAIIASAPRRETSAVLHELQPWSYGTGAILRSQLLGWRITCPLCGNQLRDAGGRELPSPFRQYGCGSSWRKAARR